MNNDLADITIFTTSGNTYEFKGMSDEDFEFDHEDCFCVVIEKDKEVQMFPKFSVERVTIRIQ